MEEVTNEVMIKTRQDDIQLIEGTKNWIDQPQRKASEKEKNYAKKSFGWRNKKIIESYDGSSNSKRFVTAAKTKS